MLVTFITQPITCIDETKYFAALMQQQKGLVHCRVRRINKMYFAFGIIEVDNPLDLEMPKYEDTGIYYGLSFEVKKPALT